MIEVNIQVRSMGPISESDMVSLEKKENCFNFFKSDLFHGLLLPSVLAGQAALFFWSGKSHLKSLSEILMRINYYLHSRGSNSI